MSVVRQPMAHPGPRATTRVEAVPVALEPVAGTLRAGRLVMDEVARIFTEAGLTGGVLNLRGGRCDPFHYVIPDESPDARHAAWYSRTYAPQGGGGIERAVAIVGWRDGAPFLHCHGSWQPAEAGFPTAGHILPFESIVSQDITVDGLGSADTTFEGRLDEETNFTLFAPSGEAADCGNGLFLRLRPGGYVANAVERVCAEHGIGAAHIHGIGSVNVVVYDDGRSVPCHATEIYIENGRLDADGRACLPVTVVDIAGTVTAGTLARGDNPVGVTFEIVVEALV